MESDTIANFLAITGCDDESLALTILEQNNWNIENSVNFFYTMNDAGGSGVANDKSSDKPSSEFQDYMDEEDIRAPIPQKMDTLVDHIPQHITRRGGYQKPGNVFEAFRDFEKERNINQDKLTDKQKTLAELFKPPLDIITFGTFDQVKKISESLERFVLVNIQNVAEFDCQKLNRDTWSNKNLKELIKDNFIFWQVNHNNSEGIYFTQIYPVQNYPYIAIIDPRTGQKLTDIQGFIDADEMIEYLHQFFVTTSWSGGGGSGPNQKPIQPKVTTTKKKYNTEDEELEMAIQLSLQQDQEQQNKTKKLKEDDKMDDDDKDLSPEEIEKQRKEKEELEKERQRQRDKLEKEKQLKLKRDQEQQENDDGNENGDDEDQDEEEEEEDDDQDDEYYEDDDNYYDNYYGSGNSNNNNNNNNNNNGNNEPTEKQFKQEMNEKVQQQQEINNKVGTEGDCSIQIRCPSEILKGQFYSTDKIQSIYYFVKVKTGIQDFKLITTFPKVELSGDLMFKTLKELDLVPRAVINLQTN